MRNFRDLKVWEKSHQLTLLVYEVSKTFPKAEVYGLTAQIRRASASIPTNIAEGCGRSTAADFARFLQIAMGSASELEYQLLLAYDLDFLGPSEYESLTHKTVEVKKMLASFIKKLKADR